jgi:hypothetical protein
LSWNRALPVLRVIRRVSKTNMRKILETEEHVQIPPVLYSDPFYRISYLMKEEIRKYKWFEGEKGRKLTWERARKEWTDAYREKYEKFLIETLSFPEAPAEEEPSTEKQDFFSKVNILAKIPHRSGG